MDIFVNELHMTNILEHVFTEYSHVTTVMECVYFYDTHFHEHTM